MSRRGRQVRTMVQRRKGAELLRSSLSEREGWGGRKVLSQRKTKAYSRFGSWGIVGEIDCDTRDMIWQSPARDRGKSRVMKCG